jgi:coenzyme F420-dependent glucose-6-phosphate dehydrogenase
MVNNNSSTIKRQKEQASIGYWAAHEQYSLQDLLKFVIEAEKCGFTTTMTSDHFHPWWHDNAYGNFTWVWIAAAAEKTKNMQFVTGVTAPLHRYHPAIIAQAFASLDVLYPGRIGLGIGTGEAMNEVSLGYDWPNPRFRLAKTKEAIQIIRKLWYGKNTEEVRQTVRDDNNKTIGTKSKKSINENKNNATEKEPKHNNGFINFNGEYFLIRNAKLYTPPITYIPLYMAAVGSESTKISAKYSDGLITFLKPEESKMTLDLFNKTAKKEGREPSRMDKIAEYKLSYSKDYDRAFKSTTFWRATLIKNVFNSSISDPRKLEEKAKQQVQDNKLKESIDVITSIEDCIKSIEEYFKVGFTRVYVHSTSPDEVEFVHAFSKKVLPYFNKAA